MIAVFAIDVLLFRTNGTNGTSVLLISIVTIGDVTNTGSAYFIFRDRLLALRIRPLVALVWLICRVEVTIRRGSVGRG
jgi:hypothetical protein